MDDLPVDVGADRSPTRGLVVSLGGRRGPGVFIVAGLVVVVVLAVVFGSQRSSDRVAPLTTTTAAPRTAASYGPCSLHNAAPAPESAPSLPSQDRPDRGIIVEADSGSALRVFHLDTGAETDVSVPLAGYPERPFVTGGAVVFLGGGNVYALPSPYDGSPTLVGAAAHAFRAGNPGWLWVVVASGSGSTVQLLDVTGRVITTQIPLPDGLTPLVPLTGGLVVQDRDGTLRLFDPEARSVVCTIGVAQFPAEDRVVLATHGSLIAWRACGGDPACSLHLTDVSKGTDLVIAPPNGSTFFLAGGALSPEGTTLAAFVDQADASTGRKASVVLIDTASGNLTPVANSAIEYGEDIGAAFWSPTSQWLYFCGGGTGPMKAYYPTNPAAIDLTVPNSYTFAAD
jgi:hypothetical protein